MQLFLLAWTGIGSTISFYLYETKQDVLLCEARPDSIKCFLFAELIGLTYPMDGLFYPNSWRV
jgi:hypothetical protein